jgi:hypothetical protein
MMLSGSRSENRARPFRIGEPGFARPQKGHVGSSELMSLRQPGQSIDFLSS